MESAAVDAGLGALPRVTTSSHTTRTPRSRFSTVCPAAIEGVLSQDCSAEGGSEEYEPRSLTRTGRAVGRLPKRSTPRGSIQGPNCAARTQLAATGWLQPPNRRGYAWIAPAGGRAVAGHVLSPAVP